jgi:hypothetical protein
LQRLANGIFICGPAVFTLVVVVVFNMLDPTPWIPSPIELGFLVLVVWHFALGYTHRDKVGYLVYAVVNLFLYFQMLVGVIGP